MVLRRVAEWGAAATPSVKAARRRRRTLVLSGAERARIAVAGDSAGGNPAAATTLTARDHGGPHIAFKEAGVPGTVHGFIGPSGRRRHNGDRVLDDGVERYVDPVAALPRSSKCLPPRPASSMVCARNLRKELECNVSELYELASAPAWRPFRWPPRRSQPKRRASWGAATAPESRGASTARA
jgi:alpha/beta hydrolase fold